MDFVKSVDETYTYIKSVCKKNNSKTYMFLDEVQELDGWEKLVNSCMIDFDCDIYVTGSNAKLLSGELATYLAGRYVNFNIYIAFDVTLAINSLVRFATASSSAASPCAIIRFLMSSSSPASTLA